MRSTGVVLAFAAAAAAQTKYNSSLDMTIDPNTVDESTRSGWCQSQFATCEQLCDKNYKTDTCDVGTLKYECLCASNNSAPGLQYYQQSLPSNICRQIFATCINNGAGDNQAQGLCKTQILPLCGNATYTASDSSTPSSTSASESSKTGSPTETNTDKPKATGKGNFAVATTIPTYGAAAMAMGILAYLL